jgi:DNA phosphorothioation-dependent restriction protein DptG
METMYEQQIKDLVGENETLKNETSQVKIWLINHINKFNQVQGLGDQTTRDDTLRRGVSPSSHQNFQRSRSKRSTSFKRQIESNITTRNKSPLFGPEEDLYSKSIKELMKMFDDLHGPKTNMFTQPNQS